MAKILGTYKHDKSENLQEYLKSIGYTDELLKKCDTPEFTVEISSNAGKYSIKSAHGETTFALNEEFDDPLPIGIILKSVAKVNGNKVVVTSTAPDGRTGERVYEFNEEGFTLTLANDTIVAKRYFKRV